MPARPPLSTTPIRLSIHLHLLSHVVCIHIGILHLHSLLQPSYLRYFRLFPSLLAGHHNFLFDERRESHKLPFTKHRTSKPSSGAGNPQALTHTMILFNTTERCSCAVNGSTGMRSSSQAPCCHQQQQTRLYNANGTQIRLFVLQSYRCFCNSVLNTSQTERHS